MMIFDNHVNILSYSSEQNYKKILTQPNANGRLFPVPKGTVAMGGG